MKRLLALVPEKYAWTLAIAGAHATIACVLAATLNVWVDEGYSLDTTGRTISYAWRQAIHFESQPPGYFVLVTAWRQICDSVFFARLLSIVCTTASILAAALISEKSLGDRVRPFVLPLLVAAQPLTMFVAVEMRRYALALFLTCGLLICFDKAFPRTGKASVYWRAAYSLAALACLYTEYFSGFILAAQSVLLIFRRRLSDLGIQLTSLAFVAVLFAPLALDVVSQIHTYETLEPSSMGQIAIIRRFASYSLDTLLSTLWFGRWNGAAKLLMMAAAALCIVKVGRSGAAGKPGLPPIGPLIVAAVLGACLMLASTVSAPAFLHPKHFIVVLVPWNLALLSALTAFGRRLAALALTGVVALNCLAGLHEFGHLAKRGDSRRIARFIERNERPGEPIIVFNAEAALGIRHHYRGMNRIVVVPRPVDYRKYDLRRFILRDESEFWASLDGTHDDSHFCWVVTDSCTDPESGTCRVGDINFNCTLFEDILNRRFIQLGDVEFFQGRVRHFRRSDTEFPDAD
ncbi:MAG TPA: hypothetical protein PKJ99_04495 [Thermoanaerobaculales bacterium]|nr:hypothetical protein [Thermoanaerobaculales bacterium]